MVWSMDQSFIIYRRWKIMSGLLTPEMLDRINQVVVTLAISWLKKKETRWRPGSLPIQRLKIKLRGRCDHSWWKPTWNIQRIPACCLMPCGKWFNCWSVLPPSSGLRNRSTWADLKRLKSFGVFSKSSSLYLEGWIEQASRQKEISPRISLPDWARALVERADQTLAN